MPNWLHNTLFWAFLIACILIVAAVPFGVALWLGWGWSFVVAVVLAILIAGLVDDAGPDGAIIAIPCWIGLALGLAASAVWKIYGVILAVLS
jgi:hypothetical protein